MAAVTSPARHAASLATSASNRERRQSKVHRAMEWPKPLSVRSSVTTSASVRARMHRPSSTSYQLGLITTTRFTPTRHSDIVHPVSSSQLTEVRDRVRSFGGYNRLHRRHRLLFNGLRSRRASTRRPYRSDKPTFSRLRPYITVLLSAGCRSTYFVFHRETQTA